MAGKKEYTLIINGVEKNIKDVTTLNDLLKNLDTTVKGVSGSAGAALSVSKGRAKALTEEEKAADRMDAGPVETGRTRRGNRCADKG